jgi:rod shape-determining protein MreD
VPATFAITREEIEVYRFGPPAAVGIPLAAVFLQAYVPLYLPFFRIFDLPLLVTIYFGVARRKQVTGLLTGSAIGLLQDSLTHQPLGLFGIAKTVVGYLASSIGVKLDVDNPGTRLLITFSFYVIHQIVYFLVARGLAQQILTWRWGYVALAALANAIVSVFLFLLLDRFRQRA